MRSCTSRTTRAFVGWRAATRFASPSRRSKRVFAVVFALIAVGLLACGEIVELFEPKAPAPDWKYRSYRTALRLTARAER